MIFKVALLSTKVVSMIVSWVFVFKGSHVSG